MNNQPRPPCAKHDWHINPNTPQRTQQALNMCQTCPYIQPCAQQALTSGTSLDGSYIHPANGVIQAGIICQDNAETAQQLAHIANTPLPTYRNKRPRFTPPPQCVTCHKPMTTRPRDGTTTPPGHVGHMAQGECTICYARRQRRKKQQERLRKRRKRR